MRYSSDISELKEILLAGSDGNVFQELKKQDILNKVSKIWNLEKAIVYGDNQPSDSYEKMTDKLLKEQGVEEMYDRKKSDKQIFSSLETEWKVASALNGRPRQEFGRVELDKNNRPRVIVNKQAFKGREGLEALYKFNKLNISPKLRDKIEHALNGIPCSEAEYESLIMELLMDLIFGISSPSIKIPKVFEDEFNDKRDKVISIFGTKEDMLESDRRALQEFSRAAREEGYYLRVNCDSGYFFPVAEHAKDNILCYIGAEEGNGWQIIYTDFAKKKENLTCVCDEDKAEWLKSVNGMDESSKKIPAYKLNLFGGREASRTGSLAGRAAMTLLIGDDGGLRNLLERMDLPAGTDKAKLGIIDCNDDLSASLDMATKAMKEYKESRGQGGQKHLSSFVEDAIRENDKKKLIDTAKKIIGVRKAVAKEPGKDNEKKAAETKKTDTKVAQQSGMKKPVRHNKSKDYRGR